MSEATWRAVAERGDGWWPPRQGDKLRRIDGPEQEDDKLVYVVGVLNHGAHVLLVTAEWWSVKQRWNYEVCKKTQFWRFYKDGCNRPESASRLR